MFVMVEVVRAVGERRFVDFHGRRRMIMCTGVGCDGCRGSGRYDSRCRRYRIAWRGRGGNRRRSAGRRQHVGHGQAIGVVGAAVHRDIVAADVGGVGVHLVGGSADQRRISGLQAFDHLAHLGAKRTRIAEQLVVEAGLEERELVDLTIAIGLMNVYNRLAIGFRNTPQAVIEKAA
jgi:hypothetical protein